MTAESDGAYGRSNAELLYPYGFSDYYLCVAKNKPELLAELNAVQAELFKNEPNYINTLKSKYYPVSVASRAFSAAEKKWLLENKKARVGYLKNYLPYSSSSKDGKATGLVTDVIARMWEGLDLKDIEVSFQGFDSYDQIDIAFPVGGGLYYSEEGGIFQSTPLVSAVTELVHKGEYTEKTAERFAVNESNRMQYYFVKTYYPDAKITFCQETREQLEKTASYGDHSSLKFFVKDTGIGMDKDFIPKIYDVFAQEDSGRSNKYGSTGLGMAITKNIIEQMNESITVESQKGIGTQVTITVPLTNCQGQAHGNDSGERKQKARPAITTRFLWTCACPRWTAWKRPPKSARFPAPTRKKFQLSR